MNPFTLIMPIHNEENMIPITFPSVYALKPDEVLLSFDRCTDHSIPLAKKLVDHLDKEKVTDFITVNNPSPEWKFRCAYLRRKAYEEASYDTILNTATDIILDPKIRDHLNLMNRYKLISFGFFDHPWTIQCFLRYLRNEFLPKTETGGLLSFSRKAWLDTEDIEDLKKQPRAEDTHLQRAISQKYLCTHINTRSLHLRSNESTRDHYNLGKAQWEMRQKSLPFVFAHSVFTIRPAAVCGYLHAKRVRSTRQRLTDPKYKVLHIWDVAAVASTLCPELNKLGVETRIIYRTSEAPWGTAPNVTYWDHHKTILALRLIIESSKYDIIHLHAKDQLLPALKTVYPHKPIILHYHGTDIRGRGAEKQSRWRLADRILVSTKPLLADVPNAEWIPNPIDQRFNPRKTGEGCVHFKAEWDEKAEKLAEEHGLKLKIVPRNIPRHKMPDFLSTFSHIIPCGFDKYGVELYLEKDHRSLLELESLSLGLVSVKPSGLYTGLPEEHKIENVAKKIKKIYMEEMLK